MWDFLNLNPECFGLDISESSLKIAKLRKKRGGIINLTSFGETKLPPGIIVNGKVKDPDKLGEIIKIAIKEVKGEKLNTRYVVASLPEEKVFLQVIQLPILKEEDLKSAVLYEAENYIPFPLEQVYLDYEVIPSPFQKIDHLDVLIVAMPKEIVDSYLVSLEKANLIAKALEPDSYALSRALIKNKISPFPVLICDIGQKKTNFIIFSGASLRFTTTIHFGSQDFTQKISETLKIDLKKAEELKIKYGLSVLKKIKLKGVEPFQFEKEIQEDRKILSALMPSLQELKNEIKKYLDYYTTHTSHEHLPSNGKRIEKILLCGGGALLKKLPEFLSRELDLSVKLADPWVNVFTLPPKELPLISFEESLKYAKALGLCLREIK